MENSNQNEEKRVKVIFFGGWFSHPNANLLLPKFDHLFECLFTKKQAEIEVEQSRTEVMITNIVFI